MRRVAVRTFIGMGLAVTGALALAAFGMASIAGAPALPEGADVALAVGSQLAVVVPTTHNGSHAVVSSITYGSTVHQSVTVSGAFGTPTGAVSTRYYDNDSCSGAADASTGTTALSAGAADTSGKAFTPIGAGAWSYIVRYDGDGTYAATGSACKAFTVAKANPTVSVVIHDAGHKAVSSVVIGTQVHPTVRVQSPAGTPTGTVQVVFWESANCTGTSTSQTQQLSNGTWDPTFSAYNWAGAAGTFSFNARYNGDANFLIRTSECTSFTVEKAVPKLNATTHDSSHESHLMVPIGAFVHPAGTLSGAVGVPTGTVTVNQYKDSSCQQPGSATGVPAAATMDLTQLRVSYDALVSKSWKLVYQGSSIYKAVESACLVTVWRPVAAVAVEVHDPGHHAGTTYTLGTAVHARIAVTGGYGTPVGQVRLRWYDNTTCSGAGTILGIPTLANGAVDAAYLEYEAPSVGLRAFGAEYLGDGTYLPDSSTACLAFQIAQPSVPQPTPEGTQAPKPTVAPSGPSSADPVSSPTGTAPSSIAPSGSTGPASSPTAASSENPPSTSGPEAPGSGSSEPGGPTAAPTAAPVDPSAASGDGDVWLVLLLALIVLIAIGVGIAIRTRQGAPPA